MQIGVRAASFIENTPILGYICSNDRAYFEGQMLMHNFQPILSRVPGRLPIWDCFNKALLINTGIEVPGNTVPIMTNEHRCDDCSSHDESESGSSQSTDTTNAPSNDSATEAVSKTNKVCPTACEKQDSSSFNRNSDLNEQDQASVLVSKANCQVTQETQTNQGSKTKKFARRSSSSKSVHVEPMETERDIHINICASPSTTHKCEKIIMSNTGTFATLKARIIERFALNFRPSDLLLLCVSSHLDDNHWKVLRKEKESGALTEWSLSDDCIVTCTTSKCLENESLCTPCNTQHPSCLSTPDNVYPLPGLQNLGNTCYMSSALQCLNHAKPFFNYFRDKKIKAALDSKNISEAKDSTLAQLYSKLVADLCSRNDGAITPLQFFMKFGQLASRFRDYRQHDSLEFMNIFLDILHEDLMESLKQNDTIVSKTFYGQIRTTVTCKTCKHSLSTDDSFSFLPLPIPEINKTNKFSGTRGYKLDHCFETFLREEQIGDHGKWHCAHCDKLTRAYKKLSLLELPPVLILQLKRFNYNLRSYTKINTLIEYDLDNLDVNDYVDQPSRDRSIRYNLIAVSNHWGSLSSGHLTTYAKLPDTQDWYEYDDDRVGKMDQNIHVNNYNACILVYQQQEKDSIVGTAV